MWGKGIVFETSVEHCPLSRRLHQIASLCSNQAIKSFDVWRTPGNQNNVGQISAECTDGRTSIYTANITYGYNQTGFDGKKQFCDSKNLTQEPVFTTGPQKRPLDYKKNGQLSVRYGTKMHRIPWS